jgi:hypothetical protein
MTVREIIEAYLKEHGYDGLCDDECGCSIDDLMECCSGFCEPGYKVPCDPKTCPADGDCEYHISTDKLPTPSGAKGEAE